MCVANKGIPIRDRFKVWKALLFLKLIYQSAIWGTLTMENRKIIEATHQQGLRIIHGQIKYLALRYGTRTNLGVRAD